MPSIPLTLTAAAGAIMAGQTHPTGQWTAGFDHAALVLAGRSRADGNDLRIHHAVVGPVQIITTGLSGLNTADCRIAFRVAANVSPATSDADYSIMFGDLGATAAATSGSIGSTPADATATPSAVPAVALPVPGFPFGRTDEIDVDENPYPQFVSPRTAVRNQNGRKRRSLSYANISPDDWYELRAFVRSLKGAGSFTPPSWLDSSAYAYIVVPSSFRPVQQRSGQFFAELEVEEVSH